MRKAVRTLLALVAAGMLMLVLPGLLSPEDHAAPPARRTVRVWITETDPAVAQWLKRQAAAWEKAAGHRVYLRAAAQEETDAAGEGASGVVPPDVIVCAGGLNPVALRGYALVVRDESAALVTPAPTGMLFSPPAASPGPSPTPGPPMDIESLAGILAPPEMAHALAGAEESVHPLRDLLSGKGRGALLTAGAAEGLGAGWQAYALPDGAGFLPVSARVLSSAGGEFAAYLRTDGAQRDLAACGLYSPALRLYDPARDPLRALIESSRDAAE